MLQLFRSLKREQRETVMAFMRFLASDEKGNATPEPEQPLLLPRPEQESVVKAIKRLRASYPMLDQNKLFHETSRHMMEHLMHGKSAAAVIDELELMFSRHFQNYVEEIQGSTNNEGSESKSQSVSEA